MEVSYLIQELFKETFAVEYVKSKNVKYKAILNTYKKLRLDVLPKYQMYNKVKELLEDEEVLAYIDIIKEENKAKELEGYKKEIIKTNRELWKTYMTASQLENKLTKNGEVIDNFFKFQDSNVVVATLQVLARQSDEIRKEIEKLTQDEKENVSDIVKIEWK